MKWTARAACSTALLLVGLLAPAVATPQADSAEVLLQAALHKQLVEGNLEEAITLYRKVLAVPNGNRAVAARALLEALWPAAGSGTSSSSTTAPLASGRCASMRKP